MPVSSFENFEAFAFGFEGVLVDPRQTRLESRRAAFTEIGLRIEDRRLTSIPYEFYEQSYSLNQRSIEAVAWMLQALNIDDDDSELVNVLADLEYDKYKDNLSPIQGSTLFVKSLAQAAPECLSIVADGVAHTEVEPFLKRNRIDNEKYFLRDHIFGGTDSKKRKPNPEPYENLIHYLGVEPKELLVIEGVPEGVESARRAGAMVVAVTNIHPVGEFKKPKREVRPNFIYRSYESLKRSMKLPKAA